MPSGYQLCTPLIAQLVPTGEASGAPEVGPENWTKRWGSKARAPKNEPSKPVSRVLYSDGVHQSGDHLSRPDVTIEFKRPTRGRAGRPLSLYSALLQVGFGLRNVTIHGRALLPHDFALTSNEFSPAA